MNIQPTPSNLIRYHQQKYAYSDDINGQQTQAIIDYLNEKYRLEANCIDFPQFNIMPGDGEMNQDEEYKKGYSESIIKEKQEWVD